MRKIILALILTLPAIATAQVTNQFGVGLGSQYGGLAGFKYTLGAEDHRFSIGAGFVDSNTDEKDPYGIAFSWEKLLNQHHALGVFVRTERYQDVNFLQNVEQTPSGPVYTWTQEDIYLHYVGASYTYFFKPASESGFLTGVNLGKEYRYSDSRRDWKDDVHVTFQLGYQF